MKKAKRKPRSLRNPPEPLDAGEVMYADLQKLAALAHGRKYNRGGQGLRTVKVRAWLLADLIQCAREARKRLEAISWYENRLWKIQQGEKIIAAYQSASLRAGHRLRVEKWAEDHVRRAQATKGA